MVAANVTSLYTNIPQQEGTDIICDATYAHYKNSWLTAFITEGLRLILKENHFEFTDKTYKRIHGTAMGAPVAPLRKPSFGVQLRMVDLVRFSTRSCSTYCTVLLVLCIVVESSSRSGSRWQKKTSFIGHCLVDSDRLRPAAVFELEHSCLISEYGYPFQDRQRSRGSHL